MVILYSSSTFLPTASHLKAVVIIKPTSGTIARINIVFVKPTAASMIGNTKVPIILPVRLTDSTKPVACERKYVEMIKQQSSYLVYPDHQSARIRIER